METQKIVIKVGTSTLTYESGRLNLRRLEQLCKVLCDLQNAGCDVVLVSSGAIGVGIGKLGLKQRPSETRKKQALAAVGQLELMFMYDKFFGEYNHTVGQVLLTRNIVENCHTKENVVNTFHTLLEMGVIPIVNENDTVAIDELEGDNFGDNDMLSAIVAKILSADRLVILTDIDGLYDKNPKTHQDAVLVSRVEHIDETIRQMAEGTGSNRGTGGMRTKLAAAQIATDAGIECCIINGQNPENIYKLLEGEQIGTRFLAGQ